MSSWLVAFVGRPNVGKSTLFNRVIGERDAIVHDLPGVTRDRNYAEAEWAGKSFTLVDTGGYVPASEDVIETAIREQAQIAIDEANIVVFVVDGMAGVIPADAEIAGILRKGGKKVILVVNKVDGEKAEALAAEFYSLGLGTPHMVSALGGRRIGDLLDAIVRDIDTDPEPQSDPRLKIAVIGKPNVGKSSFVNALLKEERHIVTDIPGTTRDPIDAVLKYYGEELLLVDTAGLRRKGKIKESIEFFSAVRTLRSIDRCDVAIIMLDAQQGLEHQDLRIIETTMERKRGAIIAVNKWDLIEKDAQTAKSFEKALYDKLRMYSFLPIIFISAMTKQRVYKVIDMVKTVEAEQQKRISTSQLNDTLGADIKTFPPRSRLGKELKINYITQVRSKPPVIAFFCNDPKMIDDNYKKYLENKIREHFTFSGVPLTLVFKKKNKE